MNIIPDIATPPIKKPPGRPSNKIKSVIPFRGIISLPEKICEETPEYSNSMELLYSNPIMFKKIFKLFKNYSTNEILMRFTPTQVNIFGISHTAKNVLYITIFGEKMNRYYCDSTFDVSLDVPKIFKLMKSINNSHGYILFESMQNDKLGKISISLKNTDTGEKNMNILELNTNTANPWEIVEQMLSREQFYPIEFGMAHKNWKMIVAKWNDISHTVRIEKIGNYPLNIVCNYEDNRGSCVSTYENSKSIHLKSELEENDIFSIGLNLKFAHGYSTSLVGEQVIIRLSQTEPIIFTSDLDTEPYKVDNKKIKVKDSARAIVKVLTAIEKNADEPINQELYNMFFN